MDSVNRDTPIDELAGNEADYPVIKDPIRFKIKLDIGEDAYAFLRIKNNLSKLVDVIGAVGTGAGVASSSAVASTFFTGNGVLALLGLGTAITPIGWVIAAGVLSGGAYYGALKVLDKAKNATVTTIPNHINTPLDLLGVGISNFVFPLAVAIAHSDNEYHEREKHFLVEHFVEEWGYDSRFVESSLERFVERVADESLESTTSELAAFISSNPDCNALAMAKTLIKLLHDVAMADGCYKEVETIYISYIENILLDQAKKRNEISTFLPNDAGKKIKRSLAESFRKLRGATHKSS